MNELCELLLKLFEDGPASIHMEQVREATALALADYRVLEDSYHKLAGRLGLVEAHLDRVQSELRALMLLKGV